VPRNLNTSAAILIHLTRIAVTVWAGRPGPACESESASRPGPGIPLIRVTAGADRVPHSESDLGHGCHIRVKADRRLKDSEACTDSDDSDADWARRTCVPAGRTRRPCSRARGELERNVPGGRPGPGPGRTGAVGSWLRKSPSHVTVMTHDSDGGLGGGVSAAPSRALRHGVSRRTMSTHRDQAAVRVGSPHWHGAGHGQHFRSSPSPHWHSSLGTFGRVPAAGGAPPPRAPPDTNRLMVCQCLGGRSCPCLGGPKTRPPGPLACPPLRRHFRRATGSHMVAARAATRHTPLGPAALSRPDPCDPAGHPLPLRVGR
jgi:hypothetical protein